MTSYEVNLYINPYSAENVWFVMEYLLLIMNRLKYLKQIIIFKIDYNI